MTKKRPTLKQIKSRHKGRSKHAQAVDESRRAKMVFKPTNTRGANLWMKRPSQYDIHGVDYPTRKKQPPKKMIHGREMTPMEREKEKTGLWTFEERWTKDEPYTRISSRTYSKKYTTDVVKKVLSGDTKLHLSKEYDVRAVLGSSKIEVPIRKISEKPGGRRKFVYKNKYSIRQLSDGRWEVATHDINNPDTIYNVHRFGTEERAWKYIRGRRQLYPTDTKFEGQLTRRQLEPTNYFKQLLYKYGQY